MRINMTKGAVRARKSAAARTGKSASKLFSIADEAIAGETDGGVGSIGAPISISDVSVLLAMQGVDAHERRQRDVAHGFSLLDALDGLKVDMLEGRVSRERLSRLAQLAARRREDMDDATLGGIMDHIELRARVELAKLEKFSRP
jgi:hypothetical protein